MTNERFAMPAPVSHQHTPPDTLRKYPSTVENGAGESLTFVRRVEEPGGDRLIVENRVAPKAGPPMHVHHHQEEVLTVLEGRIGFQRRGEPPQFAGPGETVVFPAGDPHKFWNAGEGELHCKGYIQPTGNVEYFLGSLFASQRRSRGQRPDPFEAAFLAQRYRTEFGMLEIPVLVQRFIFPVVIAVGRTLGKYAKYANAPKPMER